MALLGAPLFSGRIPHITHGLALTFMPKMTGLSMRIILHFHYLDSSDSLNPIMAYPKDTRKIGGSATRGLQISTHPCTSNSAVLSFFSGMERVRKLPTQ
jgi:hypothetical protein